MKQPIKMKKPRTELHPDIKIFRHKFTGVKAKSEETDQIAGALYLDYHYKNVNWFHPPNGGKRGEKLKKDGSNYGRSAVAAGDKMKRMGAKKGVVDYIILSPSRGFPGAVIELKTEDGVPSDVSEEQRIFLKKCHESGYYTAVAFGYEEFKNAFLDYYGNPID
jgi:hypothetical protein